MIQNIENEKNYKKDKIDPKIYLISFLTFFSIISPAILHSNPFELFNALFGSPESPLSEVRVIQINGFYDSIYYFAFIAGLILGPLSDKKGKRKPFIIVGSILFILSSYATMKVTTVSMLLFFRLVQGIGHILVWQTLMILVFDYSNTENSGRSLSIFFIFMGIAMGLGSMLGGIFADIGVFYPLIFSIIFYLVVFFGCIFLIKDPKSTYKRPQLKESFMLLKENRAILVPSIFNLVDRLHMGFLVTIVPLFLTYNIPVSPSYRGIIFGLSAIPTIILTYPIGKKSDQSWGRFKPLIGGSIAYGILLSITGYVSQNSLIIFIIILLIQGVAQGFTAAPNKSLLNDLVNPKNNATGVAFFNFFGNIGIVIGPIFAIIFQNNYNVAFLVAGIIELMSLLINYLIAKKMRFPHL